MKIRTMLAVALSMILLTAAFPAAAGANDAIVIGGKNFTEQYLLPQIAKIMLEQKGLKVRLKTGVGSAVVRQSLLNGQIDMYYEYTGTAYTVYYKQKNRNIMTNPHKVYEWVKKKDAAKGLIWLAPVHFNDTYTLMMRKTQAHRLGIKTISDLAAYVNKHPGKLVIGVDAEFWERPDGFKPLMKTYGMHVPYGKIRKMEAGLVYKALKDKDVDVSMGFATDGRISAFGFVNLLDNKHYFPVYNPAPVIRKAVLEAHPQIPAILKPLDNKLNTKTMQKLNAEVDIQHKSVAAVARQWVKENGL